RLSCSVLSSICLSITRSLPYAFLMVALIQFTQWLVGTSIGPIAATVSLTIATAPFFARLVETSLREVPPGTVDAAQVMGLSNGQIVTKVFLPEALPGLIAATTNTIVVLIGYSAMAGLIGGGGLGRLAYNYGYQRFDSQIMIVTIVVIVIGVQLIQWIGDEIVAAVDHRYFPSPAPGHTPHTPQEHNMFNSSRPSRRLALTSLAAASALVLAACGGSDDNAEGPTAGEDGTTTLTVGATPVPHGQILEFVSEELGEEANLEIEVVEFDDFQLPNRQMDEGNLDANY